MKLDLNHRGTEDTERSLCVLGASMVKKRWRPILFGLLAFFIPACKPTINPERAFTLYDIAWRCGQRDRLTPNPRDWHRYEDKLRNFTEVPNRAAVFEAGYDDGFDQHPDEPVSDTLLDYDRAFRRGRLDAWQHQPAQDSTAGYRDGFGGRPHAFHRPY